MPAIKIPNLRCNYCSKLYTHLMTFSGGVKFCQKCWDNHLRTLLMLSGQGWIDECQCCQTPITDLMAQAGTPNIKMAVVAKDGIYQYICQKCKPKYLAKRADLFAGTKAEKLHV